MYLRAPKATKGYRKLAYETALIFSRRQSPPGSFSTEKRGQRTKTGDFETSVFVLILQNYFASLLHGGDCRLSGCSGFTAVWGMLCTDDAAVVSRSPKSLPRKMTALVLVLRAFGLTVSEKKKLILLMQVPAKSPQKGGHQHHLPRRWSSKQRSRSTHKRRSHKSSITGAEHGNASERSLGSSLTH